MFLSDDIGRISFQNLVRSCFVAVAGGGRAGNDKDLPDTQSSAGYAVCSLYGLGGGAETVGDFPEGISLSNRIALRRGRARLGATFF